MEALGEQHASCSIFSICSEPLLYTQKSVEEAEVWRCRIFVLRIRLEWFYHTAAIGYRIIRICIFRLNRSSLFIMSGGISRWIDCPKILCLSGL